jgi:hypothetical protein
VNLILSFVGNDIHCEQDLCFCGKGLFVFERAAAVWQRPYLGAPTDKESSGPADGLFDGHFQQTKGFLPVGRESFFVWKGKNGGDGL